MKILSIDAFIEKLHAKPLSFDDLDKLGIIKYDVKCFDIAQLKNLDYFMVFKGQKGLSALEKLLGKETIVGFRSHILSPGIFLTVLDNGRICRIPLNYYNEDLVCKEFPEDYTILHLWEENDFSFEFDLIDKEQLKQDGIHGLLEGRYKPIPYYTREDEE